MSASVVKKLKTVDSPEEILKRLAACLAVALGDRR